MKISQVREFGMPLMNLVKTRGMPILHQLLLEERLLRTSSDNWCLINDGTSSTTIVTGISGKPSELLNESVLYDQIPVIRRFSGGGTVIVDKNTIFVSLICNKDAVPGLQPYPHPIMSWTGQLYGEVFHEFGDFHLLENDYTFNKLKFGGNAQSITRTRWIHHTSFLWDYDAKNMEYLKLPTRAPKYRLARHHVEFLSRMKDYLPSKSCFMEKTMAALANHFSLCLVDLDDTINFSERSHPTSTKLLKYQELEQAFSSFRS